MAASDRSLSPLAIGYQSIPEDEKRAFCKHVAAEVPEFFLDWTTAAGLSKGYRTKIVSERKDLRCREKLDDALVREAHADLLEFVAKRLFFILRPHYTVRLNVVAVQSGDSQLDRIDELLGTLRLELGGEPAWDFFEAAVRCDPEAFIRPEFAPIGQDKVGDDISDGVKVENESLADEPADKFEDDHEGWKADIEILKADCDVLEGAVSLLRAAKVVEISALHVTLSNAAATARQLSSNLQGKAAETGFVSQEWRDATGLRDYVDALAEHVRKGAGLARHRDVLEQFVAQLKTVRINHRVPRKQARLTELKDRCEAELRQRLDGGEPVELGGPGEPREWLHWALGLAGEEIEALQQKLIEQDLPALSEWIESCEAGELEFQSIETVSVKEQPARPEQGQSVAIEYPAIANEQTHPIEQATETKSESEAPRPPQAPAETSVEQAGPSIPVPPVEPVRLAPPATEDVASSPGPAMSGGEPSAPVPTHAQRELFSIATDRAELARMALKSNDEATRAEALNALAWRLIHDGNRGLAFQIAADLERKTSAARIPLPSALARAAALAMHVQSENGELYGFLKHDLRAALEQVPARGDAGVGFSSRLLLAAASLRPALLAPHSGAASTLREAHLGGDVQQLNAFAKPIWEFGDRGVPLNPEALEGAQSKAAWEDKLTTLRAEAASWWKTAQLVAIVTRPGAGTWREMLEGSGVVGRMLLPVRQGLSEPAQLRQLRELIEQFDSDAALSAEAHRIFTLEHRGQLVEPAAKKIVRLGREASLLARRWVTLHESRPDGALGYLLKHAAELRAQIETRSVGVIAELRELTVGRDEITLNGAVTYTIAAVENVRALFAGGAAKPEPPSRLLLHAGLLRFPELDLNENWEPRECAEPVSLVVARALGSGMLIDWSEAFQQQARKRDHEATGRIIEMLEWRDDPAVNKLRVNQEQQIEVCRAALLREVQETRSRLDRAMRQGLITRGEFDVESANIAAVETTAHVAVDFHRRQSALAAILAAVGEKENQQRELARRRLRKLPQDVVPEVMQRIEKALNLGDIVTAHDYIERAERGAALPEPLIGVPLFEEFFGSGEKSGQFFALSEELAGTAPARIAGAAHNRTAVLGVDFKQMPPEQAERTANAIEAWFAARQQRGLNESQCGQILAGLGFTVLKVEKRRRGEQTWLEVTTVPTNQSPVAAFGSEAAGHYRVFAAFNESMENLCALASPQDFQRHGTFVFYFDAIDERRRRELARLCREKAGAFAVIDTILLLHVCSAAGTQSRLPRLFACALPFSRVQPYVTTAGRMPPEIFFGRQREVEEITSPSGSCFVYGGRQLGKTALLRHVEERFHDPKAGRIAIWLELKHHGVHSIDDVWPALAAQLAKASVFPESTARQMTLDTVLEHAADWLAVDDHRRILLLLDEADNFLKADATDPASKVPFSRCLRLRALMDSTGRRFKVVFAGLHNVQRTTRVANHPLAHYGVPLCIGPLLNNPRDAEDARRLVEEPLAAAGYFFESSYPLVHILAQSNYYPSLIQLYCQRLLRHATDNVRQFDSRTTPPFLLTLRHVEDAYNSLELQSAIAEKFRLTLDLDKRYRLIAIIFAFYKDEAERGLDVRRLRNETATWWSLGLATTSDEDFGELLEEMVGLGVLRRAAPGGAYFLRNPNLMPLLGRHEDIETELENFSKNEPESDFDPSHFRRPVGEHGARSPLSIAQESEIRSLQKDALFVFAGTPAAEISRLREAIEAITDRERLSLMSNLRELPTFAERLREFSARPGAAGVNIVFLPAETRWNSEWLQVALDRLRKRDAEQTRLAIVFVATPELAWDNLESLRTLDREGHIALRTLRPWNDAALRQWLEDCLFGPRDPEGRREICEVTGNWPLLLGRLYRENQESDWKASLTRLLKAETSDRGELLKTLAGDDPARLQVLKTWAELGGDVPSSKELAGLCAGAEESFVERVMHWAHTIGIATRAPDSWLLDPFLAQLLAASGR